MHFLVLVEKFVNSRGWWLVHAHHLARGISVAAAECYDVTVCAGRHCAGANLQISTVNAWAVV